MRFSASPRATGSRASGRHARQVQGATEREGRALGRRLEPQTRHRGPSHKQVGSARTIWHTLWPVLHASVLGRHGPLRTIQTAAGLVRLAPLAGLYPISPIHNPTLITRPIVPSGGPLILNKILHEMLQNCAILQSGEFRMPPIEK